MVAKWPPNFPVHIFNYNICAVKVPEACKDYFALFRLAPPCPALVSLKGKCHTSSPQNRSYFNNRFRSES